MTTEIENRLLTKFEELAARLGELDEQLARPEVVSNPSTSLPLVKEAGRLRRLVEPYTAFREITRQLAEARAMVADPQQDGELRALAREEIEDLSARHDRLLEELKARIVTNEDAVIRSVILEIRAGTGGEEAALFARNLYEMYLRFCERRGFVVEVLDQSATELGGIKEVVMNVKGEGAFLYLGYEGGGHRVQRVPKTEAQGRVHTSAATVAVLPEPEDVAIDINWESDVEEYVSRAGGPGGQNVNKVASAIRLVHKETGVTVSMRDEKSQHKNRAKARRLLMTRVYDYHQQRAKGDRDRARRTMVGSGDRSQRVRTYNFPQNRCTDHRINLDLYNLDKIMQGELDTLVEALQTYDKEQRLKNL